MAKLSLKQLGKKGAELEWFSGPKPEFWNWQKRLSDEEWVEVRKAFDRRSAQLEDEMRQDDPDHRDESDPEPDEERQVELDHEYDTQ